MLQRMSLLLGSFRTSRLVECPPPQPAVRLVGHRGAMTDLSKSTYSGEFGFLIVEPAAGRHDNEFDLEAEHRGALPHPVANLRGRTG